MNLPTFLPLENYYIGGLNKWKWYHHANGGDFWIGALKEIFTFLFMNLLQISYESILLLQSDKNF